MLKKVLHVFSKLKFFPPNLYLSTGQAENILRIACKIPFELKEKFVLIAVSSLQPKLDPDQA